MAPLARLEQAHRLLAEAKTVDELKDVRDKAEALRLYVKQRDMGLEAQNFCAEIKLRAERRLGEMLAVTPMRHGARPADAGLHHATPDLEVLGIEKTASSRWQRIAGIPEETFERYLAETRGGGEELTTAGALVLARQVASGQNQTLSESLEWYTPGEYIESARSVLGTIDLDPASSDIANRTVKAKRFFGTDDDGLSQAWEGTVWLNPPYTGVLGPLFVEKLLGEYTDKRVTAAVVLVSAHATDTNWFQPLWDFTLCFTDHRLKFLKPSGAAGTGTTHGSVFAYLGKAPKRFADEFSQYGVVVRRWP